MTNVINLSEATGPFSPEKIRSSDPKSTLIVNFDLVVNHILESNPSAVFDKNFFASSAWPDRPNSGQRLSLVHYQALRSIATRHPVSFIFHLNLPPDISKFFDEYSTVVILQAPNPTAKKSLVKILDAIAARPTRARIIFGTELTWFADLDADRLSFEQLHSVYTDHTLLRHTARTDLRAYADTRFDNASIQEFEIGIDCEIVKPSKPIQDRQKILFVRAPEGRQTKNNEGIDEILDSLQDDYRFKHLEITILQPPYTTVEYWDLLQQCRYLIFTSHGETFSYVLNDARASGVVSFFPAQMFDNRSASSIVDSYPEISGRYHNTEDLLDQVEQHESSPNRLETASTYARSHVLRNFSVPRVARNWLDLLHDRPLNTRKAMYAHIGLSGWSMVEALERCQAYGCEYLIPYFNLGIDPLAPETHSWYEREYGVTIIRDFVYKFGGKIRLTRGVGGKISKDGAGRALTQLPPDDLLVFWRILLRVNKIGEIYTNLHPNNESLAIIRSQLRIYYNSHEKSRPVEISYI